MSTLSHESLPCMFSILTPGGNAKATLTTWSYSEFGNGHPTEQVSSNQGDLKILFSNFSNLLSQSVVV